MPYLRFEGKSICLARFKSLSLQFCFLTHIMQASHLTPKMCLNLCLFCFFYCHIWKLIIQCPNISCHLCCDKINNSSNRNQTSATFSCWMRNILCCIYKPKFGEIHHFILNEIIFNQLIYNFILFTVFEITSKEGFCTATQVLFLQHIFFQM